MSAPIDDLMGNALTEPIADVTDDSEEFEISVVDDRPEEDQVEPRGESQSVESDEEIDEVGGRASKRISKLKYEYHEERRAKEAAERLREEAVQYAQSVAQQNHELKSLLHRGEKVLLSEIKQRADVDLERARKDYKSAYEEGNPDALIEAQEALTKSQYEREIAERSNPQIPSPQQVPQQAPQQAPQQEPPVDPKLRTWLQRNEWFGKDEEMTSFAYGVHEKLVRKESVDPKTDEYYSRLDERLRQVFPGRFENGMGTEEPAASSRTSTVVAPANRSSGRPRKVQLTSTQVALAKRLGITPEQYAKQLLKEMR
tara:strand:+ start:3460 stop:4401 length:942 start_codon:yes stop_codon:yes gene_type:complete